MAINTSRCNLLISLFGYVIKLEFIETCKHLIFVFLNLQIRTTNVIVTVLRYSLLISIEMNVACNFNFASIDIDLDAS